MGRSWGECVASFFLSQPKCTSDFLLRGESELHSIGSASPQETWVLLSWMSCVQLWWCWQSTHWCKSETNGAPTVLASRQPHGKELCLVLMRRVIGAKGASLWGQGPFRIKGSISLWVNKWKQRKWRRGKEEQCRGEKTIFFAKQGC